MTVVDLDVGSLTVSELTIVDSQPDIGDTDVKVLEFKAEVGSVEAVTIEQITVTEAGTASTSDTNNIELYSITDGASLGTESAWNAEGKASWPGLDIVVGKGENHRFRVMVDIVSGSGLKANADLVDGGDVLISAKGNTYGFYITPVRSPTDWNGKGEDQSIRSGALNVSKSAASPATGNIAPADDQVLTIWDFTAQGEDVKITALTIDFDLGSSGTALACSEVTNVKVYDEDDNLAAGPKDCSSDAVAFTDTFIVPVGTTEYTVKVKIATAATTGDWIEAAIDAPSTDITAAGMTTNDSITPSPTTQVEGNKQTVAAGDLSATTLTEPQNRNVAKGVSNFVWMTASLSAGISGEDVNVTSITIYDTIGGTTSGGFDDIDNCSIWADLTDENSARGDIYETRVSDLENPTATGSGSQAFSLTQTITVTKGTFNKIAFVGNLSTGATTDDTHTVDMSALTATGADTGSSISVTPTGGGQAMTVKTGGALTVTNDASTPTSDIVLGEETVTLAVFRLAADSVEDLDLDSIYIHVTGGTYVNTFYFYHGDTLIQYGVPVETGVGTNTVTYVAINDGTVTIPANGHEEITVKATLNPVAHGTTLANDGSIQVSFDGSTYIVDFTGLSSGSEVPSTDAPVANTMYAFESRPYFAVNSASPSGDLIPTSTTLLAIFDITADAAEDITFDNADSNTLTVSVSCSLTASDGDTEVITLKDQDGNDLTALNQHICDSTMVFDFSSTADLTVPAGQAEKIYIYGDTTELSYDGDIIQLWLDDGTSSYVDWGIDGDANSWQHADIIFRGDILAGALVNPS